MPRGSKPGERRGGRAKGVPNKKTREQRELQRIAAEQARDEVRKSHKPGKKLGKDLIEDYMMAFHGMAAMHQNNIASALQGGGSPAKADLDGFKEWGSMVVDAARRLAPFQSPTFKAIAVVAPPPGTNVTPNGELPPGTEVHHIRDPQVIARVYAEIVRTVR